MPSKTETVVLGGGCFWCTEAVFQRVKGVIKVTPGYSGGKIKNPTYEEVSTSSSGHAETIKLEFDPMKISFGEILDVFFHTHDPTTKDRQGADVGTQYRSMILATSPEQLTEAKHYIQMLNDSHEYGSPILTEVKLLDQFYPAESYHKDYYNQHPHAPYCTLVIAPKIKKLLEKFPEKVKS